MRDPWDDDLAILSAENVNFAVETAGLGSRFTAATVDLTLQLLVLGLLGLAYNLLISYLPPLDTWGQFTIGVAAAFSGLLVFTVIWGYYFLFEWLWDGQTPGKRWFNLRVMMANGMPLTPWAALVRNLIRIADFLPFCYGVGALIAVVNPNNRRAGDLIAGTVVARERHDAAREVLSIAQAADAFLAQANQIAVPPTTTSLPAQNTVATPVQSTLPTVPELSPEQLGIARRLNEQDYELVRDFLLRRDKLPTAARERLAQSLALRLAHKTEHAPPAPTEAEAFLEAIARLLQQTPVA
jgi:uncharacterized RDD family membrane protein YckC